MRRCARWPRVEIVESCMAVPERPAGLSQAAGMVHRFNALRELGGARRIVEDEVRARLREYGTKRRRLDPPDAPFADRRLPDETGILELTSRISTDKVPEAKALL